MRLAPLALALVPLLTRTAPPAVVTPPTPRSSVDSMVSVVTDRYELFAATPRALADAREELDFAVRQFHRYFGEDAPKVAVVVFESADKASGFDFSSIRKRGLRILPWVVGGAVQQASAEQFKLVRELGVVLSRKPEGVSVLALVPVGGTSDFAFAAGDVIRAVNGTPVSTVADFGTAFDAVPVGGSVKLDVERGGKTMTAEIKKPAATSNAMVQVNPAGGVRAGAGQLGEAHALSHEACHMFLITLTDRRLGIDHDAAGTAVTQASYGHPSIPDWFDEATATLCEYPALQQQRRDALWKNLDSRIPLAELFTMEHPVWKMIRGMRKADSSTAVKTGGAVVQQLRIPGGMGGQAPMFYAEALSVAQFLAAKEGDGFIGKVADGLMHGRTMPEILRGAKSVPADVAALDAAWQAWALK